jgi:osmotically-inducible protein OsmY
VTTAELPLAPTSIARQSDEMAELCQRVLHVLERSPYLPRNTLRFEAAEGRVVLRGVVKTYFQKQMAQEALRRVSGVEHVDNQLEVDWA